jgi:hypothetical protein
MSATIACVRVKLGSLSFKPFRFDLTFAIGFEAPFLEVGHDFSKKLCIFSSQDRKKIA